MDPRPALARLRDEVFSLDVRSLAVARVMAGVLLLADLAMRALDLGAHYTDAGAIPRGEYLRAVNHGILVSLHALSGATAWQALLFAAAAVFAAMLVAGWHTRVATVASFVLLASLHARAPSLGNGGDQTLRLLLFWAMFLPWGAALSLDRRAGRIPGGIRDGRVVSIAVAGLLVQVAAIYLVAFATKTGPGWRSGVAIQYVLGVEPYATSLGRWMQGFPALNALLVPVVLLVELMAPLLLFFPRRNAAVRLFAVVLLLVLHAGLGVALRLGLFPFQSFAMLATLLPGLVWQRVGWQAPEDVPQEAGPQSVAAMRRAGTTAVHGVAFLALVYVAAWNWSSLDPSRPDGPVWERLRWIGYATRLEQGWSVFAPELPTRLDGWFLAPARLSGGGDVDLMRAVLEGAPGRPPPRSEKPSPTWPYRRRWVSHLMTVRAYEAERPALAGYLCRRWNAANPEAPIEALALVFVQEVPVLHVEAPPTERIVLWEGPCPE